MTTIDITAGTFFKAILVVGLVGALYFLRDLVLVLLTAVVIASSIEPGTRWFIRYGIPRVLAVLFIYLSIAGLFFSILYFFVPPLLGETSGLLTTVSQQIKSLSSPYVSEGGIIGETLSEGFGGDLSLNQALEGIRGFLENITGNALSAIRSIFGGFLSFVLIVVISFYLSVQEHGIENFLRLVTPVAHEKYIVGLWKRTQTKIGRWMQGQLLLGLLVGILVYLGLTVLGVQNALALAGIAALFEIIPIFGPILSAIPAIMIGFLDSFTLGLMVAGLYVIIQQFENHLIYPLVVRKVVGVSPIVVILSLIIGAKFAGFLGIVLAVPVATALLEFVDDIQSQREALQKGNEAG